MRYAVIALPLLKWTAAAVGHSRVAIQEGNRQGEARLVAGNWQRLRLAVWPYSTSLQLYKDWKSCSALGISYLLNNALQSFLASLWSKVNPHLQYKPSCSKNTNGASRTHLLPCSPQKDNDRPSCAEEPARGTHPFPWWGKAFEVIKPLCWTPQLFTTDVGWALLQGAQSTCPARWQAHHLVRQG